MDEQRKQIILKEIQFWKENRMLPEQYCNYLLSIYSEGDSKHNSKKMGYPNLWTLLGILPFLIIPIVTYLLYFTELSLNLQILIYSTVFIFLIILAIFFTYKKLIWRHFTYIVLAIVFLEFLIEGIGAFLKLTPFILGLIIISNCIAWISIGLLKKLNYFIYSGVCIIIFYVAFLLFSM